MPVHKADAPPPVDEESRGVPAQPLISLVIALYNEEIRFFRSWPRLLGALEGLGEEWELLLVDDGSSDATLAMARGLAQKDGRIRVLRLSRNLGQGAAVKLGILATRGDVVLYSDADLSIPLHFLKVLIDCVQGGSPVVVASRWMPGATITVPQPFLRRTL